MKVQAKLRSLQHKLERSPKNSLGVLEAFKEGFQEKNYLARNLDGQQY
jgi:hypothetical protein